MYQKISPCLIGPDGGAYNTPVKYLRVILIVLLVGCCTLWVASYWRIKWVSSDGRLVLSIWNGSGGVGIGERDLGYPYGLTIYGYVSLHTNWWPAPMFGKTSVSMWFFRGSFWLPTLLLALPLAISASPWSRRRRRAKQGLCIRCGYDLSGTEHEACPECGTEVIRA